MHMLQIQMIRVKYYPCRTWDGGGGGGSKVTNLADNAHNYTLYIQIDNTIYTQAYTSSIC